MINLIKVFKESAQGYRDGKIFDYFEYGDNEVTWTSIPDLGENNAVITIFPIWIDEEHTVYFSILCDDIATPDPLIAKYDTDITLPNLKRTGYTFNGWYTTQTGGAKITWTTMPDLTPNDQNNGSTSLFARWTAITYTVKYSANGGSGSMSSTTHTYDKYGNLRANAFSRIGHDFAGWARSASGNAVYADRENVINLASAQSATVTLYAVWEPIIYTITFKNLTSSMHAFPNTYTYGQGLNNMPQLYYINPYGPQRVVEPFYGWYKSKDFATKVEGISKTQTGNITLYAKYDLLISSKSDESTHTVTDDGIGKNPSVEVTLNLKSFYYDHVKDTTLNKIKIEFSLTLWEIDDGYQHIYLINENYDIITDMAVWSKKIDHTGGKKRYSYTITLDMDKFKNNNSLKFKFDASGFADDDWKFNNFEATVYLTN